MIFIGLIAPLFFMGGLLLLARMEEWVVAPIDRADRIARLLQDSPVDEIEQAVAEYLAPVVPHRREVTTPVDADTKPIPALRLPQASGH